MFVLYFTLVLALGNGITGLPYNGPNIVRDLDYSRIMGGKDAPDRFARHMVALLIGDSFVLMVCGGSIVSKWHVLTAAHCIHAVLTWGDHAHAPVLLPSLRGVIGSNKYTSTENVITYTHYINHPDYNSATFKYDVGVLFTSQKIQMNDRVAVMPLKTSWVGAEEKCYVTGWGANGNFQIPEKLQLLYVSTLGGQECVDAVYYASQILGGPSPPVDPEVEICTFHSPGHGMCNGDSGSALVSTSTGEQVGIVAWGRPCAVGAPDVFVRISGVMDFLKPILYARQDHL